MHLRLLPVQQLRRLRHVRHCHDYGVHQLALPVRPDVRFHPEISLVALLDLVHLGSRCLAWFLVKGSAAMSVASTSEPARREVSIDSGKEDLAQGVGFEPVAEVQERGGIGHAITGQVNAGKNWSA